MATFAQLRAFHLVASTGGFSQAAREASTSQSALSGHVRALEAESGRALFERQARRVVPTMDGQDLYAVTTRLFSALTEASALLNSPAVEGGRLRVVADGAAHSLPILRALTTKRPKLHFTLDIRNSDQVLQQIKEHRADVGVTAQRPDDPNLHAVPLTTMKVGLMAPADSVWAGRRQAVLADLSGQPFVLSREYNFLLGADEALPAGIADTARSYEQDTVAYWRQWTQRLALPLEWQEAVIRAAITLKLSLYEDTGAIVAAMTTSIPESAHSGRNWDYRFCWLRDAFFVVRALNSLSETATMEDYLRWLSSVVAEASEGHIQPLYGIGLERELPEFFVPHLKGYRGMGPVRVGNQAAEHFQHDVYGNIILGAAQAFHDKRLLHPAGEAEFTRMEQIGELAVRVYGTPDAGMWELRTRARVHTSSALMSWAACDRLAKIAAKLGLEDRADHWKAHASRMREEILTRSWSDKRQAFAESFGGHELDASVLLMAEVGLIDPRDPRFVSTVDAMEASLCDGPYMRRYEAADDFGKPDTAFNICTFWRIDALARIGRRSQAREIFEAMLAARNPLGLLSEDTHAETGEMWGNFPQTYSMVGIINAAMRLSAPWDSVI